MPSLKRRGVRKRRFLDKRRFILRSPDGLGLTEGQAAELLGADVRTFRRWYRCQSTAPGAVSDLVSALHFLSTGDSGRYWPRIRDFIRGNKGWLFTTLITALGERFENEDELKEQKRRVGELEMESTQRGTLSERLRAIAAGVERLEAAESR